MKPHSRYFQSGFTQWLNGLSSDRRSNFERLRIEAMRQADDNIIMDLMHKFNIKSIFSHMKYPSSQQFVMEVIFNAADNLSKIWRSSCTLFNIQRELYCIKNSDEKYETSPFFNDSDNESYLFASLIWDFKDVYLNTSIKSYSSGYLDTSELEDFDLIVEFITWFKWIEHLMRMLKEGKSGEALKLQKERRHLGDIALQLVWQGTIVDNQNQDEIAGSFPEMELKNGEKLKQKFNHYSQHQNRVGDSEKENENRLRLKYMNHALKYLTKKEQIETAQKEVNTFKESVRKNRGQKL